MARTSGSNDDEGPDGTASRVAALESRYDGLRDEIHGLRRDFGSFASEVRSEIASVGREMSARGRTNWAPIISGVAVVVSIIGGLIVLGAQGPLHTLTRVEMQADAVDSKITSAERNLMEVITRATSDGYKRLEAERELKAIWEALNGLRDNLHTHEKALGHTAVIERLAGVDRAIVACGERLNALDARTEGSTIVASKIESIQREIELLRADVSALKKP